MNTPGSALEEEAGGVSKAKDHERLSNRLAQLLSRLYQGEHLQVADLALEFGVTPRTLQRDLARIGHILPIRRINGAYQLAPDVPRPQALRELQRFADVSGLQGLYPRIDSHLVQELTKGPNASALHVHGPQYEDIGPRARLFDQIEQAVKRRQRISFIYTKTDGHKTVDVAPYQFINHSGIWYLAAVDGHRLKAYSLTKISRLLISPQTFERQLSIEQQLREEDGIWLNRQKTDVLLHIAAPAADYFRRRKLIAGQRIDRELPDGGLIVACRVAHPNQVLPLVRYWLPNARILSPGHLQAELEQSLRQYLETR